MISIYIRETTGNRAFKPAPAIPGDYNYWLRFTENGKQKWQHVGEYAEVKKAILLLERQAIAKAYDLLAPTVLGRVTVPQAIEKYIQRKIISGKRPNTVTGYKFTLGLFAEFCPYLYIDQITGDTLLDFAAWCRKRGDGERTVSNRIVDIAMFMKFNGKPKLVPQSDWPKYTERLVESYTQEELDKFYAAAETDKERLLLDLLIHSGFRIGEISHLCYSDVDFAGNKLSVTPKPQWDWKPKTNSCRTVRVPAKVMKPNSVTRILAVRPAFGTSARLTTLLNRVHRKAFIT